MSPAMLSGYLLVEAEEIVKETDTAFLLKFSDGEEEWLPKVQVANPSHYSLGDRNVIVQLVR